VAEGGGRIGPSRRGARERASQLGRGAPIRWPPVEIDSGIDLEID
jgi:hypothetical protein